MANQFRAGAVLYARNPAVVRAFYHAVLRLDVEHTAADHVVLASPVFQLVVVTAKSDTASPVRLERATARGENLAIKLGRTAARFCRPTASGIFKDTAYVTAMIRKAT